MLNHITEWLLALLDLYDLERRRLKQQLYRLALGFWIGLLAVLTLLVGMLLVAWGVERWLSTLLGPIWGPMAVGGLLMLTAAGLGLWVRRLCVRG